MSEPPHPRTNWPTRLRRAAARGWMTRHRRSWGWRLLAPAVFVAAGVLLVSSAISSGGTDLRAERYDDLADLATQRADRLQALQADAAALTSRVDRLTEGRRPGVSAEVQARVDALRAPAGLTPVQGPGVTVSLDDAPKEVLASAGDEVSQAIVHQQDIQAVVNAMWLGGAEAMTVQGQRITSTTGIKCVGNVVVLHGVPYSPPYVISAVGDVGLMLASIDRSAYIQAYLQAVEQYDLGWDVRRERRLELPGYDGSTELEYARAAPAG